MSNIHTRSTLLTYLCAGEKLQVKIADREFEDFNPDDCFHKDTFLYPDDFRKSEWRIKPKIVKIKRTVEVEIELPEPFKGELCNSQEYLYVEKKFEKYAAYRKINFNTSCGERHVGDGRVFLNINDAEIYAEYLNQSGE